MLVLNIILGMLACFCDERSFSLLPFDELRSHFKVDFFTDSASFKEALRQKSYSAILLNDDIDLLTAIQAGPDYNGCPIIVATLEEDSHRLKALSAGAHDFYTDKMKVRELVLKLKNKQNSFTRMNSALKLGNVTINFSELKTYLYGKPVDLTLIEMKVLRLLIKNYPEIVSKDELVNDVWPGQKILPTTINTHIYNVRSKFKPWEFEIVTIKSQGYALTPKHIDQH